MFARISPASIAFAVLVGFAASSVAYADDADPMAKPASGAMMHKDGMMKKHKKKDSMMHSGAMMKKTETAPQQ